MGRDLLLTCLAMAAVVIAVTFFLTIPQEWSKETVPVPTEELLQDVNYTYELKEQDGKLAIFFYGEKQPQLVLDVYIQTLPEVDQDELKAGLAVKDYEELLKRIEDYSS